MPDVHTGTAFAYLDTNVISYIAAGIVSDFLPGLLRLDTLPVTSDVSIRELAVGAPNGEIGFLKEKGVLKLAAHEPLFKGTPVNFYRLQDSDLAHTHAKREEPDDALEAFVADLLRVAAGEW